MTWLTLWCYARLFERILSNEYYNYQQIYNRHLLDPRNYQADTTFTLPAVGYTIYSGAYCATFRTCMHTNEKNKELFVIRMRIT